MSDPSAPANSNPYAALASQVNSAMDELSADTTQYIPDHPATQLFSLQNKVLYSRAVIG